MAVNKVQFANSELKVISVKDDNGELWMFANPFALVLNYSRPNDAIRNHVSDINVCNYEYFKSRRFNVDDVTLHPLSKFINRAGLFELIQASRMPKAQEFRDWINSDLLPKLCDEGKYDMATDAPMDIANGMNAVHAAINDGAEAPWIKDLEGLKTTISEKNNTINNLTVALQNSNEKLHDANEKLITFANALVVANTGLVNANVMINEARKEIAYLANRMADIAQDVIAKPSDSQLLHSLAVCALGNEEYAFLRTQKRNFNRSLKRLGDNDVVYKSDYVPNAMNVLNKVKETLPKDKFKAKHNKITLLENLTRDQLIEAVQSSMTERQIIKTLISKKINKNH
ncbi:bro-3 [Hyposidra talaca nucleopolyhedrovirus]|uniref:Bro-3 n=1 Tax=Hyposidra talaca nucleopolyhedrovirus TaxID=1070315 RepID=A0A2Z4HI59_9ABAC|nr:bro-3 [Hyposidra talaca nucleopolyhedrovirus]AWW14464.1 bro-3 [Hyposidra talaca nucleopolyhedrovirus]